MRAAQYQVEADTRRGDFTVVDRQEDAVVFRTPNEAEAQGFRDGLESPTDLGVGMTYSDPALNEAYDRGVNAGQARASR